MIGWEVIGGAIVAAFFAGLGLMRTWMKRAQKVEDLENAQDTHDRIDAVEPVDPDNLSDVERRLRELAGRQ